MSAKKPKYASIIDMLLFTLIINQMILYYTKPNTGYHYLTLAITISSIVEIISATSKILTLNLYKKIIKFKEISMKLEQTQYLLEHCDYMVHKNKRYDQIFLENLPSGE